MNIQLKVGDLCTWKDHKGKIHYTMITGWENQKDKDPVALILFKEQVWPILHRALKPINTDNEYKNTCNK